MEHETLEGTRGRYIPAFWLFMLAGLAFAITESVEIALRSSDWPQTDSYMGVLLGILPIWLIRGGLAPLVGVLVRRVPLNQRRLRNFAIHILASAVFAVVHLTLFGAWEHLRWENPWPFLVRLERLLLSYFAANVIVYWAIACAFLAYDSYQALRVRDRIALELRSTLAEARLHALRGQLQPHFLFNALNTVAMLIREGLYDQAVNTLAELSELLRRLVRDSPSHEISLAGELEFVRRYAAIEELRFGDRLRVTFDVPDELQGALVPALVLQPLVENAVRHGVKPDKPGNIIIRARRVGESLQLEVEDNGCGLQQNFSLEESKGVGLRNTVERLSQLYQDNFAFALQQPRGGGLIVALTTPLRYAG